MFIFSLFKNLKVYLVAYKYVVISILGPNAGCEEFISVTCRYVHHLNAKNEGYRCRGAVCYSAKKVPAVVTVRAKRGYAGPPADKVGHHLHSGLYRY